MKTGLWRLIKLDHAVLLTLDQVSSIPTGGEFKAGQINPKVLIINLPITASKT
jgi:hypothetical protein